MGSGAPRVVEEARFRTVSLIKKGPPGVERPAKPEARALLAARALDWLAERQGEDGGFPQTLSGMNGSVVQTSMAGFAWIAGGLSLEGGPHAENLARAVAFVSANVGAQSALGYVELNIVGGLALCALGLAQEAGCTLDEEKLERLMAYLDASSNSDVSFGEVWTTACRTCVLICEPPRKGAGGLPGLLGD